MAEHKHRKQVSTFADHEYGNILNSIGPRARLWALMGNKRYYAMHFHGRSVQQISLGSLYGSIAEV